MAKTMRPGPAADETDQELPLSEQITYLAGEGDPPSTKWHGIVFHANVPKTVNKPALIEAAKNNRFFKVGTFDPQKDAGGVVPLPSIADPKTSEQYRAHVVEWLRKVTDIDDFVKRWASEGDMRMACEVGSDDYSYLGTLLRPKMHELQKVAQLNDLQLAELWVRHGVNQLPF
jgi:hypothetical protein